MATPGTHIIVNYEQIPSKRIGEDVRGAKDLRRFSQCEDLSIVLLDVAAHNPFELVKIVLDQFVQHEYLPQELMVPAIQQLLLRTDLISLESVVSTSPIDNDAANERLEDASRQPPNVLTTEHSDTSASHPDQARVHSHSTVVLLEKLQCDLNNCQWTWRRSIQNDSCIIAHTKVYGLTRRLNAFVRMRTPANLGAMNDSLTHFVMIILAPSEETKVTKSDEEMARNFASLVQDELFYSKAVSAASEQDIRTAVLHYVDKEVASEHEAFETGTKGMQGGEGFEDMKRTGKFCGGLIADIKRKYKWSVYKSDYTDGMTDWKSIVKYISTIAWLYFAVLMPIVALGAVNDENTNKQIGISETVLSQAICGMMASLFAGQPLGISMTTGPVAAFIDVLYSWSESLNIDFLPFYAWTGIWSALMLIVIVAFDLIAWVKYVGQFTEEIFAGLVACIFISYFISPLVESAENDPTVTFLLNVGLAFGTFAFSRILSLMQRSYLLNRLSRTLLSDFGMPCSVVFWSGMRQIFTNVDVPMLEVPDRNGFYTSSGRSWLVDLGGISVEYIFLAIVPGILLTMLFFVDQNVAILLTNKKENKLQKGVGYFLDNLVTALSMIICSVLGLPWANAAVPHSALHARILADVEEYEVHGRRHVRVVRARETRITNLATHILMFASMFALSVVGYVPYSVVWGFFLYIGVATLDGNQLFERVVLVFTQPEKYPPNHYIRRVPLNKVFLYTLIQLVLLIFLWFVNKNFYMKGGSFNFGLLYPLVIICFIPIRLFLLPKIFTRKELVALEMEKEDVHDM